VEDFSFRGVTGEYSLRIIPQLSVGVSIGWNVFQDLKTGTFEQENVAYTGSQGRSMEIVPLCGTIHYYLASRSNALPYAGVSLGGYHVTRATDYFWFTTTAEDWHFGVAPELGVHHFFSNISLALSAKFNYLVETDETPEEMYFGFNIGIVMHE
jgi:hypothetical protein